MAQVPVGDIPYGAGNLKNNARLEIMYQTTALQAFQFCLKYARDRVSKAVRASPKPCSKCRQYSSQMHAINLSDPDTLQRHLDTRFQQLNVAVELELWQEPSEAWKISIRFSVSASDLQEHHDGQLLRKAHTHLSCQRNYLFHAAAWSRYYNLLRQSASV
jgi:translation initiation factor 3 subunit A